MTDARHYLKKITTESPHIIIKKTVQKSIGIIKNARNRNCDLKRSTYGTNYSLQTDFHENADLDISGYSNAIDHEAIPIFLNHRFNLHGSGWVQVYHGMKCQGLRKHRYDIGETINCDDQGKWLEGRINTSNLAESQRIWRLIEPPYTPIDWHIDFKSGYRWPENTWYKDVKYGHEPGADVKVPWELARMQHLPHLVLKLRALPDNTDQKKILLCEFRNQVLDFMATNPPQFGVNWVCEMDIAIRAVNLLVSFYLLRNKDVFSDEWNSVFWGYITRHGERLYNKVTEKPFGNNHYAAELAGLYCIGLLCPFLNESEKWRTFSKDALEDQITVQFRADGTNFEESTSYHLLVADIFLYSGILADSINDAFSEIYRAAVHRMLDAVQMVTSTRYEIPQIGDNDEGYFIKPALLDSTHSRIGHLLRIGRRYVNGPAKWTAVEAIANILRVEKQQIPLYNAMTIPEIRVLQDAGWIVLEKGPMKIVLCVGAKDVTIRPGHAHEDILSFSLYWKGCPVIVDPGTYVYTPDKYMRNKFRYAISHNQPKIAVNEKKWSDNPVFLKLNIPETRYSINNEKISFSAQAQYESYIAKRKIQIDEDGKGITISDELNGDIHTNGTVSLCLHPDVKSHECSDGRFELFVDTDRLMFESGSTYRKEKGFYSAGYGMIQFSDWLIGQVGSIVIKSI